MPENATRELDVERSVLGPDVEISHFAYTGDDKALIAACRGADAILTEYVPFSRAILESLDRCQVISVAATGHNCIDLDAAAECGISVCCIDEYCTDEVADHTVLLMLALCRRLPEYHDQVQTEHRWQFDSLNGLRRMSSLTLGIVGFGRIGQAVARRARAFGMTILAYDLYPDEDKAAALDVSYRDLPDLLAQSDVVSLNCALTPENEHLINESAFNAMARHPVLINCARGGLVDEDALIAALDSGQISGAGLDVLADEAPDLARSRLIARDNVILTPHVAFYSDASILENRTVSAGNIRNFLDGKFGDVNRIVQHATK
jgi:D-3-phosphoglycerate dehydrogenase